MPLLPQGRLCENMLTFSMIVGNMNSLCVNVKEKVYSPGYLLCPRTPFVPLLPQPSDATATAGEAV